MKKLIILTLATLTLGLAGCETQRERNAVGGAAIGAGTGAIIGGLATGRAGGAYAGALVGGVAGAVLGANSTPSGRCGVDRYGREYCERPVAQPRCYRDEYGRRFCE